MSRSHRWQLRQAIRADAGKMVDTADNMVYSQGMEATTTCQHCNGGLYRSSTPTIDDQGRKSFGRHVDTGFASCPERLAAERQAKA